MTKTEDLLTHTPGATGSSHKPTITGGLFFEGKQEGESEVVTTSVQGIVVAEASVTPSASSKKSGAGRVASGVNGGIYAGCVMVGMVGLWML